MTRNTRRKNNKSELNGFPFNDNSVDSLQMLRSRRNQLMGYQESSTVYQQESIVSDNTMQPQKEEEEWVPEQKQEDTQDNAQQQDGQQEQQVKLEEDDQYPIRDLQYDQSESIQKNELFKYNSIQADLSLMSTQKDEELQQNHGNDEELTQESLRKRMKAIDDQVRSLTTMKNRLKYILKKKEGSLLEGESEPIPTKTCKCCNKDISKLCFRCEHIYCKVEECARKKKQVLNARMLIKMREKKGEPRNLKKKQLNDKKQRKRQQGAELSSVEEESSIDSNFSSFDSSSASLPPPAHHETVQTQAVPEQSYITLPSDISTTSFLNVSFSNKSELYFEQ